MSGLPLQPPLRPCRSARIRPDAAVQVIALGVVVSAVGSASSFAVTDAAGRYRFRELAPGPYLLRAHLEGYVPASGSLVQVNGELWRAHTEDGSPLVPGAHVRIERVEEGLQLVVGSPMSPNEEEAH